MRRPAARCSRALRRTTRPAAGRTCVSSLCRRERTCSFSLPQSTLATCAAPNRWPTRATHERIFRARTHGSATGSSSPRQKSHAPQSSGRTFAEVADQVPVAAADACGVALHVAQQLARAVGQLAVLLEHEAPFHEVGRRVDEHALGLEAVAARRGPTPAGSAPATAARRRARRSGRRSDRSPSRRRRSRR